MDPDRPPFLPPVSGPALRVGEVIAGRFKVLARVGVGGMGEVVKAFDATLERPVALKAVRSDLLQDPEAMGRLRREALALAQLNHPNVCQVHDWVETPQGAYLALEWVEGETLDEAAKGRSFKARLRLLRQVLSALEAAHTMGIVHRDLKPANVMVTSGDLAKVLDFGLARLVEPGARDFDSQEVMAAPPLPRPGDGATWKEASGGSGPSGWEGRTQAGFFMGSPAYASPEQIGGRKVGPPSDLFSFGILAWELLFEQHPFPGEGRARMQAIATGERNPVPFSIRHHRVRGLLERCLARKVSLRPTATAAGKVLARQLAPPRASLWAAAAMAVTLFSGGLGTWLYARGAISDLVRHHPARLVVLPFSNATGDHRYNGLLRFVLPEEAGDHLADLPQFQVVEQGTLAQAARRLGLDLGQPLDERARQRLAKYLGAALVLHGVVRQAPDVDLAFRLEDASGHVRAAGDVRPGGAPIAALQGLASGLAGRVQQAIAPLSRSRKAAGTDLAGDALFAYGQGTELMARGAYKDALPLMRTAAFQAPYAPGPVVEYASCLFRTGDPATDAALRWALSTARLAKDRYREVLALKTLSLRERDLSHLEAAATASRQGLDLASKGGYEAQQAAILNNLGLVLQDQDRNKEALACFTQAAETQRRLPDPQGLANSINNLAVLARSEGDFTGARARYQEALALQKAQENRYGEALALTNLGDLDLSQHQFDPAKDDLLQADRLYQAVGNRAERAVCQLNLGLLDQCQMDFEAAEGAFRTARKLAEEAQASSTAALVVFYQANLARQRGRIDEAVSRYTQAARQFLALKAHTEWAECMAGLAECALERRPPRLPEADGLLKEAARKLKPEDVFLLRARWRRALAGGDRPLAGRLLDQTLQAAGTSEPEVTQELQTRKARPTR